LKRPLVRLRGQWSLVDAAAVAGLLRLAGQRGEASGADLLRSALDLGHLDLPPELELAGVEASGPLGALLAGDQHQRAEAMATPEAFRGELRPYQQRGLGWLVFLGRLGLGACLADDMGLGKTAQLIASLLADPLPAPTLVVAPVTLLGNWRRELERFAPNLVAFAQLLRRRHRPLWMPPFRGGAPPQGLTTRAVQNSQIPSTAAITR